MTEQEQEKLKQHQYCKQHQMSIASSMELDKSIIKFLDEIPLPDWKKREWYFICALDNMPLSNLIDMEKRKYTVDQIRKAKLDYFRKLCVDLEPLGKQIAQLETEVKEVCTESKSTREILANNVEKALERQAQSQQETIDTKDKLIATLEGQIKELKELQTTKGTTFYAREVKSEHVEKEVIVENTKEPEKVKWFSEFNKNVTTKKFIDLYIKPNSFSDEQKEFLLSCLEEGMSVKSIEKFASKDLTVPMMNRLKKLQYKE